jgi:hypothetical protein
MPDKKLLNITFPDTIKFEDLKLSRDPVTGDVSFDWMPIELICQHSGIDSDMFRNTHEDNVAGLLVTWYNKHLQSGGAPDPVAEELLEEIRIEDTLGLPEIKTVKGQ